MVKFRRKKKRKASIGHRTQDGEPTSSFFWVNEAKARTQKKNN